MRTCEDECGRGGRSRTDIPVPIRFMQCWSISVMVTCCCDGEPGGTGRREKSPESRSLLFSLVLSCSLLFSLVLYCCTVGLHQRSTQYSCNLWEPGKGLGPGDTSHIARPTRRTSNIAEHHAARPAWRGRPSKGRLVLERRHRPGTAPRVRITDDQAVGRARCGAGAGPAGPRRCLDVPGQGRLESPLGEASRGDIHGTTI